MFALAAAGLATLSSCGGGRDRAPQAGSTAPAAPVTEVQTAADIRTAEPSIFALAGHPLVLTLLPADAESPSTAGPWMPTNEPAVTFMTGEPLDSALYWVWGEAPDPELPPRWLPHAIEWQAMSLVEAQALHESGETGPLTGPGFWALWIDIPARAAGREIRLDGRSLPLTWLSQPPKTTDVGRAPRPRATPAAVRAAGALLHDAYTDPLRSWRVRLLLDRYPASQLWDGDPPTPSDHPALAALSAQNEWRWRAAIAALARSGPDTAADVLARLTALTLMPSGALLPAWPLDDASAVQLRNALLDADADDEDRLNAAQTWLASMPPVVPWVLDDGPIASDASVGRKHASTIRRTRIAVTDLTGRRGRAGVTPEGQPPRDSQMVEAHESAVFNVESVIGRRAVDTLSVSTARWSGRVAFHATALVAAPPGAPLGPLLPMWTMPGWLAGNPGGVPPAWTTAGLLQRSTSGDGWEVYVECLIGPPEACAEADVVRLWWGAPGAAERYVEAAAPPREEIEGDRWTVTIPVPPQAINADGTVLLGLERDDCRGARSSWPRPVMLGDAEPVRALIDLKTWGDLGGARAPADQ